MTEEEFIVELSTALGNHSDAARINLLICLVRCLNARSDSTWLYSQHKIGDGFFTIRPVSMVRICTSSTRQLTHMPTCLMSSTQKMAWSPQSRLLTHSTLSIRSMTLSLTVRQNGFKVCGHPLAMSFCRIPVVVVGHNDYGTVTPVELHSGDVA